MEEYMVRKKHSPKRSDLIAGWSPGLQIYVVSVLQNYSFAYYCDFFEITKETYDRFEDPDFDPPLGRLLFSEAPVGGRRTAEEDAIHERFYGR